MNYLKMFRKIPFGRIIPRFSFESSESYRFFNYLRDSNSIFRAAGIISEGVFDGTVTIFLSAIVYLNCSLARCGGAHIDREDMLEQVAKENLGNVLTF